MRKCWMRRKNLFLQPNMLSKENNQLFQSLMQAQNFQNFNINNITLKPPLFFPKLQTTVNEPPKRKWMIKILDKNKIKTEVSVEINIKIRGEEASCYVPDKLYSSHKYVFEYIVRGVEDYKLIVSKLQVIKPQTNEEIMKNDKNIVKGNIESALTKKQRGLEGGMRIQFTSNSYHHGKGYFSLKVQFYDPNDLKNPLFYCESPSFRVYARKPSIGTETLQPAKTKVSQKKERERIRKARV